MRQAGRPYRDLTVRCKTQSRRCIACYEQMLEKQKPASRVPFLILMDELPEKGLFAAFLNTLADIPKAARPEMLVILLDAGSRKGEDEISAWELLDEGIRDIYRWTGEDDFTHFIESTLERSREVSKLLESSLVAENLVGNCAVWRQFLSSIIEVAVFSQNSFLLTGESGTGKELISRLIHTIDRRPKKKDLVVLDCTTIVPELSGSEFFGHERGAYTNAVQSREGAFSLSNNGTLFLDEIGELPLNLQAGLLRVIQERQYKKVGSNAWQQTDFRLVCATHRNLRQYIDEHKFRQDLFFRISDFEFHVPALRERREDIPLLSRHFLQEVFGEKESPEFDDSVMEFLMKREYPGNVRELRQLVRRICPRRVSHKKITPGEIPPEERAQRLSTAPAAVGRGEAFIKTALLSGASLRDLKNRLMDDAITAALEITAGDKKAAADKLGVTMRAVQQFRKRVGTEAAEPLDD